MAKAIEAAESIRADVESPLRRLIKCTHLDFTPGDGNSEPRDGPRIRIRTLTAGASPGSIFSAPPFS
jgi:hypothetical protein